MACVRARQHARLRAVHHGQVDADADADESLQALGSRLHRQHRAPRQLLDQLPACAHEFERIRQRHHPGQARGHVLAQAVTHHGVGLYAPVHELAREGVLHDEHGRLRDRRVGQAACGVLFPAGFGIQQVAQVATE
jgi:hypothetical protein